MVIFDMAVFANTQLDPVAVNRPYFFSYLMHYLQQHTDDLFSLDLSNACIAYWILLWESSGGHSPSEPYLCSFLLEEVLCQIQFEVYEWKGHSHSSSHTTPTDVYFSLSSPDSLVYTRYCVFKIIKNMENDDDYGYREMRTIKKYLHKQSGIVGCSSVVMSSCFVL